MDEVREAEVELLIQYMLHYGKLNYTEIARTLNAEGIPVLGNQTWKGRPVWWTHGSVQAIISGCRAKGKPLPKKGGA